MKILVTGAAGYIGTVLVNSLADNGHEIYAYDNFFWHQEKFVTYPLSKTYFYNEDVTNWSDRLKYHIDQVDVIIPLAALVGAPLCDTYQELAYRTNQLWIEQLLPLLNKQLVIFPNTNSSYGSVPGICTEETPLNPLSLYAKTKDSAESILRQYSNHVVFRLATVFGMSYRPRLDLLVNSFVNEAIKNKKIEVFEGDFRRNYCHVKDIARAFDFARLGLLDNTVYNLGNDTINCTKLELAQQIASLTGASVIINNNRTDGDKRDYLVSSNKLYKKGFSCQYDLSDGVSEIKKFIQLGIDDNCFRNY